MWRDEVRAFSVATGAASWSDLLSSLHQEGHPLVWYAILRIGYAATHSALVLPVASLTIAWGAAYLMLRFAPFPFWERLLAVFGVFMAHEFSVVSRNYGVGILLMLAACILFPSRHERPMRLGLVLALLANTSVHAALASMVLAFVWLMDGFEPTYRRALTRPWTLAAIAVAVLGVALALTTARPSPDMAYAFSLSQLEPSRLAGALLTDPGWGLRGIRLANIAAAGEIPWGRIGVDPELVVRIIADIVILSILWGLRRNRACLIAAIVATLSFEALFRLVYSGALRHDGMLAFLLISLSWIACSEPEDRVSPQRRRSIALGLLPLLVIQAVGLPFAARRDMLHPASSSKAFATLITATPRYRDAILVGEPDYFMEALPYYVGNRVFMPRVREFHYRVYFDRGQRRRLDLRLGELIDVADSLACASGRPVLLAMGYAQLASDTAGETHPAYRAVFRWDSAERSRLFATAKLVHSFANSTSDENYNVFEIPPGSPLSCRGAGGVVSATPRPTKPAFRR
jgi:hypothetical protein